MPFKVQQIGRGVLFGAVSVAVMLFNYSRAYAQDMEAAPTIQDLKSYLDALRAEQEALAKKIDKVETALLQLEEEYGETAQPELIAVEPEDDTSRFSQASAKETALSVDEDKSAADLLSRLQVNGDLRLRYEGNFGDRDAPDRNRAVLRSRLSASYDVYRWLKVGSRLVIGDPDDPNTADVSLGNFDDDLMVNLDQVYAAASVGNLTIYGGKFPQVFRRTDLVWDGDVNLQGVGGTYHLPLGDDAALSGAGVYFVIDEDAAGPDSHMTGGQLTLTSPVGDAFGFTLSSGYYDYTLDSLGGADIGDFRSNLLGPDGAFLSDFNLFNAIGTVTYNGFGEHWPVSLTGDYVRNLGAANDEDTGFGADIMIGRASEPGDWRFRYGYASVETDAVLAAFSNDNLTIATNYIEHAVTADFIPATRVLLNLTYYLYRPKTAEFAGPNEPDDYLNRLRLNVVTRF